MKISICMATYNGENYIQSQISSIIHQMPKNAELIISDNGSCDNTIKIINSFNDERIILYTYEPKNITRNFENALTKATGDIIFLSDQDDVWLPGRLDIMVQKLYFCDLVVANAYIVDQDLTGTNLVFFGKTKFNSNFFSNLYKNNYIGCCMAFRGNILLKALPFPNNIAMHDWWIGLVASIFFHVEFIDTPLLKFRRHFNNASTTLRKSKFSLLQKFLMRTILLIHLSKFYFDDLISRKIKIA